MGDKVWILHDVAVKKKKKNQNHVISTVHDIKPFAKMVIEFWEAVESR